MGVHDAMKMYLYSHRNAVPIKVLQGVLELCEILKI